MSAKKNTILRAPEDALPMALLSARESMMVRFRPLLAEFGLTEQQWRVIREVQDKGKIDATSLSERCCILMPSLSRILKTLVSQGILTRKSVPDDRRRQLVVLTNSGQKLFNQFAPKSEAIYSTIEDEHGAENMQNLLRALTKLQKDLSQ